jgi:hypothetical protein
MSESATGPNSRSADDEVQPPGSTRTLKPPSVTEQVTYAKPQVPTKDRWDKLQILLSPVSTLVVAIVGAVATILYNQRQEDAQHARDQSDVRIQQIQTVERFMPYLTSGDARRTAAALKAISALGNDSLSIALARIIGDSGSRVALGAIAAASQPRPAVRAAATRALTELLPSLRASVVQLSVLGTNLRAAGVFVTSQGIILTTADFAGSLTHMAPPGIREASVATSSGRPRGAARLVATDTVAGVSLLQMTAVAGVITPVRVGLDQPAPNAAVMVFSPDSAGGRTSVGAFASGSLTDFSTVYGFSFPPVPGSPVVEPSGLLVGIVHFSLENSSRVTRASELRAFLLRAGVGLRAP